MSIPKKRTRSEINTGCRRSSNYPEEEDRGMVHYLAERAKHADAPFSMADLWKEYVEWSGSKRTIQGLRGRFRRHLSLNLHRMTNYSLELRVRMLFVTSCRLDKKFLEELRRNAKVSVDQNGAIVGYDDQKPGGLKLLALTRKAVTTGNEEPSRKRQRAEADLDYDSENDEEVIFDGPDSFDDWQNNIDMGNGTKPVKYDSNHWDEDHFAPIEEQDDYSEYKPVVGSGFPPITNGGGFPPISTPSRRDSPRNFGSLNQNLDRNRNFDLDPQPVIVNVGSSGASEANSRRSMSERNSEVVPVKKPENQGELGEFMSVMKDFVSTQTQWIKMQMDPKKESFPSPLQASSSSTSTIAPKTSNTSTQAPTSSKKGFLHLLRSLVLGMDRPELEPIRQRITSEIQRIGDGDEKLAIETISTVLEGVLDGIN